jgi:hypothetical protein
VLILSSIFLFTFLLFINLISASSFGYSSNTLNNLIPATLNQEYTILQTCDNATWINLSISNINGFVITNVQMINNGTSWYYKFTPNILSPHDISFLSDGCEKSGTTRLNINSTNNNNSIVLFIFLYILFYGITLLGLLKRHVWITLGGCFGLLILGVYTGTNGIDIYKNGLTDAVSYITLLIGLGLGFETVYEITNY